MGNSANNIVEKTKELFDRQVPREKAKKIAMIATVIITIIILVMSYKVLTAKNSILGEWKSRPAYDSSYDESGYYYIDFDPDGECWVRFDIENSILGWGIGGTWSIRSISLTGIDIIVRTDWEERLPNQIIYHYNPFTNKLTWDSLVYKMVE